MGPEPSPVPPRRWLLIGVPICLALGVVEFNRALDGNLRAWVYTFEWPAIAGCIYFMYRKIRSGEPVFKPYRPEDYEEDPRDS